jgi:hypothetical protein
MKYTLLSVKNKFDISIYLDKLKEFEISEKNFKMVDFIDGEELECIKYKINLLTAEDFMTLSNIINNDIIITADYYDIYCNIIKEPTILIKDGYIE